MYPAAFLTIGPENMFYFVLFCVRLRQTCFGFASGGRGEGERQGVPLFHKKLPFPP